MCRSWRTLADDDNDAVNDDNDAVNDDNNDVYYHHNDDHKCASTSR
jgi:hypothetical protein